MNNFEFALCAFGAGVVVGAILWNLLKTKLASDIAALGSRLTSLEQAVVPAKPTATTANPLADIQSRLTAVEKAIAAPAPAKPAA